MLSGQNSMIFQPYRRKIKKEEQYYQDIFTTWPLRHNDTFYLPANRTHTLRSKELT